MLNSCLMSFQYYTLIFQLRQAVIKNSLYPHALCEDGGIVALQDALNRLCSHMPVSTPQRQEERGGFNGEIRSQCICTYWESPTIVGNKREYLEL